jgi:CO dehydrogenase/acetyl-CoA synthase beta subunit
MGNAVAASSYVTPKCSMCQDAAPVKVCVVGNPERFCSLTCCKIFYSRPTKWICQHRSEV